MPGVTPFDAAAPPLRFVGHRNLPTRLALSTLTGRPMQVTKIRSESRTAPGLRPHEVSLIRLITSITNGTSVELSATGTALTFRPGLIVGTPAGNGADAEGVLRFEIEAPPRTSSSPSSPEDSDDDDSDNSTRRGISYWLVPICLLAPFAKNPVSIILSGPGVITGATSRDISADAVRTGILPLFSKFGIIADVEIRVLRRACHGGHGGGGGGQVHVVFGKAGQVRLPKTVHFLSPGKIRRVRGVAYSVGVGSGHNGRMIDVVRSIINPLCADTYVYSDVAAAVAMANTTGPNAGKRTGLGFGISLVAETSTGALYSADVSSSPTGGETAEDIGRRCALQLLDVIDQGGCLSRTTALPFLILMALGSEDVGRVAMGRHVVASEDVIALGRDIKHFGLNPWGFRDADDGSDAVIVSVVGKGVGNVARKVA